MKLTKDLIMSGNLNLATVKKEEIAEFAATLEGFILEDGTKKVQMNSICKWLEDNGYEDPEITPAGEDPRPVVVDPAPEKPEVPSYLKRRASKIAKEMEEAKAIEIPEEDYENAPAYIKRRMLKR
jgi:hypothetical protein